MQPSVPSEVYVRACDDRRHAATAARRRAAQLSYARLLIAGSALALLWPVFGAHALAWPWLLLPGAAFLALARWHERVLRARSRAERAQRFYERGIARLEDRWAGSGSRGEEFSDPTHAYATDLDLFGNGSLFELLCSARTRAGEKTLALWLLAPAPAPEVLARQRAVAELRGRLELREDLAVLGEDVRSGVDTETLVAWSASPPVLQGTLRESLAGVLALLNALGLGLFLGGKGPLPFLCSASACALFALVHRSRTHAVLRAVERPATELRVLGALLGRLERERFEGGKLGALRESLRERGAPASLRILRLARLVEWNDSRRNQIFGPLSAVLLLGTQLAFAMERWRTTSGSSVRGWITTLGEIEALSSLAAFAYENPDAPFPEIVEGERVFEARGLTHPLLPRARAVRNDLRLEKQLRLLMVSGSNMSGKSTLLRSVGLAVVLALAGAVVPARRLRVSCLQVGASMRVLDSIQEGTSRFYAEILRLRTIVDLARSDRTVLFLLDEILHGTNSHDRSIGAAALIRGLLELGAMGLVTTHDLALAKIADELGPQAANVHFEDEIDGERIVFDYRLKPGVVARSNALALMRAVGLEV